MVLSVLWFVSFGLWLRVYLSNSAGEALGQQLSYCTDTWEGEQDRFLREYGDKWDRPSIDKHLAELRQNEEKCRDRASASFYSQWVPNWAIAASAAISVALLWLVVLIAVSVVRWVAAGFRRASP